MSNIDRGEGLGMGRRTRGWLDGVLFGVLIAAAIWMISPMFTSSYVEAYVARLQSMAMLNHVGRIGLDDQAYPINTELLYVTRVGMVWLMQMAMSLFHSTGLLVLRVITIASIGLLAGSSFVFARRWAGAQLWAVLGCVVLTPGIMEPSFFIADNLVAASLTCLALALVGERVTFLRWFAVGAIVACATLVRLDAVLIVPAVLAVLWLATPVYRKIAVATGFATVGVAAVFLISYKVTGVSLIQCYEVGRFFSAVNNNPAIYQTGLMRTRELIFFGFFGLVTLPLLGIGAWENFKRHGRAWSVVMTLLPMLFYAAVIPHANEIRDFCIMGAPFVLLHAATGLRRLIEWAREADGTRRWWARAAFAGFVLVFVAPPYISMRDGPRTLTGRLYSPIFWRQWQGRTLGMIDQIQAVVDDAKPGQPVLAISSQFEPERYLHLRLLQEGFQIQPVAGVPGTCQSIEKFDRDGRIVISVRTENPYGMIPEAENGHRLESEQIVDSLQCLRGQSFARRYFFSIGESGEQYLPGLSGAEVPIPRHFPMPILHKASYGFFGGVLLTPAELERLDTAAIQSIAGDSGVRSGDIFGDDAFRRMVGHRFWMPKDSGKR